MIARFPRVIFFQTNKLLSTARPKIYTKTGDKGETSLLYGERVKKSAEVVSALGTTDELSSNIGVAMEYCRQYAELSELVSRLAAIQCRLQELNSTVASRGGRPFDAEGNHIKTIEGWIDEMDSHLVPLRAFILPSGGLPSAHLHVARSVCRRAERSLWSISEDAPDDTKRFLNRLSDFLFVAARLACMRSGNKEVEYKSSKK